MQLFGKIERHLLGADAAGRIEAIGRNATQFQVGDDVFGCIPLHELGSLAEYVCAHEDALQKLRCGDVVALWRLRRYISVSKLP